MMKRNITDKELRELLREGDPEKTSLLNLEGGSLYENYYVTNIEDLPYNSVLCCYVWEIGDIEWYLHERFIAPVNRGESIFEDKEVMKRAVKLIEDGFEPKEEN